MRASGAVMGRSRAIAGRVILILLTFAIGVPFAAAPLAHAEDTPESGVVVFDLDSEGIMADEHTAQILWNLNGNNLVEGPVKESWISSYLQEAGTLGGSLVIDLDTRTMSGKIIESWKCDAPCGRWTDRNATMTATIDDAQIERDGSGWRILGKDAVNISYRAWGGWDETPSDCGGTECYVCAERFCTFDTKLAAKATPTGRLEGTKLTLAFVDRLEPDASKMDLSGLTRTVFFMSRFSLTVTGEVPESATTTEPVADTTATEDTAAGSVVPAPSVDAATPTEKEGADTDGEDGISTAPAGSAGASPEDDGAGGLGSLILTIALVFGVGVAALLLRTMLRKLSGGEPTTRAADQPKPVAKKSAVPVVSIKISNDETKRIVDWGVENNRTPEDIQRDVDARNENLGGRGVVPITEPPKRINLPQGEVTVTPAEHAEYGRRTKQMADQLDNAKIHRGVLEKLAAKSRYWSAVDKAVIVRWIFGTKEIYDQGLKINNPGAWIARKGGFDSVEDMLASKYGKPTWMTYETHRYGSLTEAVEAWKKESDGGWSRFQADRADTIQKARSRLRTMLARPKPTGKIKEIKTFWDLQHLPDRVFLGPNIEAPAELLPTSSPSVRNMSWYNRPSHELKRIFEAQRQGVEYLRNTHRELDRFVKYESDLARRIKTPVS